MKNYHSRVRTSEMDRSRSILSFDADFEDDDNSVVVEKLNKDLSPQERSKFALNSSTLQPTVPHLSLSLLNHAQPKR